MAKKIIILDRSYEGSDLALNYVFWIEPPSGHKSKYADPQATSAYTEATAQELAQLRNGSIVEVSGRLVLPNGTPDVPLQTKLISLYNEEQSKIGNAKKWSHYGSFWDGTSWTMGGING